MYKTRVLVININNLSLTRDCLNDLKKQTVPFDITIVDNGSDKQNEKSYLMNIINTFEGNPIFISNIKNIPVNKIWNKFYKDSDNEYLCYLNNDVRITENFIEDSEKIFENEPTVGITCHATNNQLYKSKTKLKYIISDGFKQGWDFTIRKNIYVPIHKELQIYCGDDWIFEHVYRNKYKTAMILSSPIIHFQGMSTKYAPNILSNGGDVKTYIKLGYSHNLMHNPKYSRIKPTFNTFI